MKWNQPNTGWVYAVSFILGMIGTAYVQAESPKGGDTMTISTGKEVSLEYTLKLKDNQTIDTNVGGTPLTYTQGTQQIIPGLEQALEGMAIGDNKQVMVAPEDGYDPVNPSAFQEVPKEQLPAEALQVGAQLQWQGPDGQIVRPRVSEIRENTVLLDFNHPLAGETLYFDVKILDIKGGIIQTP